MWKFIKWSFLLILDACIALVIVIWWYGHDDFVLGTQLSKESLSFPIIIQDRNGKEIHRNFGQENREWISIEEIPQALQDATILSEDRRFYYHFGVDFYGIARAIKTNYLSHRYSQGASTLTQQIARKVFLSDEKSIYRKLREMYISFGIEYKYSKKEILEMYLNTVPYGPRTNGVKLAAREYFNKNVTDLTEAESMILAIMPKNPVRLSRKKDIKNWMGDCDKKYYNNLTEEEILTQNCSPFVDPDYKLSRVESLLEDMVVKNAWSLIKKEEIWQELQQKELSRKKIKWTRNDFQHFQFFVRKFLTKNGYDFSQLKEGLIIKTSLDSDLQKKMYHYLRNGVGQKLLTRHNMKNFAVLLLDNDKRSPLVWIGSKYFWNQQISGQIDMLNARRQTGSTIKPFIYYGAIEQGYQPPTILYDSSVRFKGDKHWIRNSDGHFLGAIRMTRALAQSRNIPAAKAFILAGGETMVKNLLDNNFGFDIKEHWKNHAFGWTLSLGTAPVKVKDLANAYATLGEGRYKEICPILEIRTISRELLKNPCSQEIRPINNTSAYFINHILSDINARPKAYKWRESITMKDHNMAVKTGTSSKRIRRVLYPVDNFVVGYTPNNTLLMWGGNTDGEGLVPGSVSISTIAPYWKGLAQMFYKKYPEKYKAFTPPSYANIIKINGELATDDYVPPSYAPLAKYLRRTQEMGINPLRGYSVRSGKRKKKKELSEQDSVLISPQETVIKYPKPTIHIKPRHIKKSGRPDGVIKRKYFAPKAKVKRKKEKLPPPPPIPPVNFNDNLLLPTMVNN